MLKINPRHVIKEKEMDNKQYRYKDYYLATNNPKYMVIFENVSPSKVARNLRKFENPTTSRYSTFRISATSSASNSTSSSASQTSDTYSNDDPRIVIQLVHSIGISKNQIGIGNIIKNFFPPKLYLRNSIRRCIFTLEYHKS